MVLAPALKTKNWLHLFDSKKCIFHFEFIQKPFQANLNIRAGNSVSENN